MADFAEPAFMHEGPTIQLHRGEWPIAMKEHFLSLVTALCPQRKDVNWRTEMAG